MEEPLRSVAADWVPTSVLELDEGSGDDEENMQQLDLSRGSGGEEPLGYTAQELEEVNQLRGSYNMHEFQADYAEREDGASDCHSRASSDMLSQVVDAEASLRAEILDLGRRMRTAEPGIREREFLAASNSNGFVDTQDLGSCAAFRDEHAFSEASTVGEAGMPPASNGWSHEDHEVRGDAANAVIVPGLRGLAAATGGPFFCDYLVDADDDLGLDTPEAIWRPPLMRRPPDRAARMVDGEPMMATASNGVPVYPASREEAYSEGTASAPEVNSTGVTPSPRKGPPGSATATPRPRARGRAGAAPPVAPGGGSAASSLGGSGGGGSSASAQGSRRSSYSGSDAVRRTQFLERARCNRAPQGMQPRGARPARSAEVQALQAEVAMQEVQLRRLLTAQPGENIPDEVAFEAARLWQGLESIRSVIGTLQERIGEEAGEGLQEEMLSTSDAGFVEDAYVMKADSHSQGSSARIETDGNPDGFDEIARLEAATSILTRQPRRVLQGNEERRQVPERQGAFRGLVRGSGTGGGAGTRVSNTGVKRQERSPTPLKSAPRPQGMPGKLSGKRPGASQVSSAVNIGVAAVPTVPPIPMEVGGGSTGAPFGSARLKSPVRERRSVSAPRGGRRTLSPAPKPQSRPASPRSGSTMRRTTSPTPKSRSRPTSPRSPRGPKGVDLLGGGPASARAAVHPHTPPPPPKRSPIDARDAAQENVPRRGGAGTPHSPSSQHSVVVRASGASPGGASYWQAGVAPVALHGGAAADHAVLGNMPVSDGGVLGKPISPAAPDSGSLMDGAVAPPMPL